MLKPVTALSHKQVIMVKVFFWIAFIINIVFGVLSLVAETPVMSSTFNTLMLDIFLSIDVIAGFSAMGLWNQLTKK